jgi:hypothetical protein
MKLLVIALMLCSNSSWAATVSESLYILRDSIEVSSGDKLPYVTFNSTPTFSPTNARIELTEGDQLDLWIVNLDPDDHHFEIKGVSATISVPSGDSINIFYTFNTNGVYVFHDPLNYPSNASLGLGGMIVVKDHPYSSFYWNIKEHKREQNDTILNGGTVDWTQYYPEFYTINGKSNPAINQDPDARITGNVGEVIYLYVVNTGQSIHALHFHGYHLEIMYSSRNPEHVGRMKDSQGIYPAEGVVFRLIPDKEGEYPVHDHNLIGTTGANLYPLGMFTTMLIEP